MDPALRRIAPSGRLFRWKAAFMALGLALACNPDVADDELEATPAVPPRSFTTAQAEDPFIPAGPVWTLVHGIRLPLVNKIDGMVMVDYLDIGNEAAEVAHSYSTGGPAPRIERDFLVPVANVSYREDGRALRTSESFIVQVAPRQDNFLVKALDTIPSDQKVRVRIDDVPMGTWSVPNGNPDRYGEAVFPLSAAFVGQRSRLRVELEYASGNPETNAFIYWVFAKPARKLTAPIRTDVEGLWLTDRLDVGNPPDEVEHGYVIDAPTFGGDQQFEWPDSGQAFIENGRATGTFESFNMAVIPGRDHLLVKAFDNYSRSQVLRVIVESKVVGDWALPDGSARYDEGAIRIPAECIGARREVTVRIELVSASLPAFNSFQYWMFAQPPVRHG